MGVKYTDIIDRMKRCAGLKNDSKVALALGVTPQAISNYKKRGTFPSDLVLKFAGIYGISIDWLVTGEGEMKRASSAAMGIAAEEKVPYGEKVKELASLSADELIYVGKLLKVIREGDKSTVSVLKWSIDAFLKAIETK